MRIQYQQSKSDPNHRCKHVSNFYQVRFPIKPKTRYGKILAEDVTEICSFLLMILAAGNDPLHQNSTTDELKDIKVQPILNC